MEKTIKSFQKTKDYLVCIDSDGCAIDSMTIKHVMAFGPAMVETFRLEEYREELLEEWNRINLYSMTRGINRFKGLNMILHYCDEKYRKIERLEDFDRFCETTKAFSNGALTEYKEANPSPCLDLCLEWSNLTNKKIKEIPDEKIGLFRYVKESIKAISEVANIAVVSSANFEAIWKEWERLGILEYVDCFCSQLDGTKAACIHSLLFKGYRSHNVIMFGDGPGDWDAARDNGVYFYPILCRQEDQSWKESLKYIDCFTKNTFGEYQEQLVDTFKNNLE